MEEEGGEWTGDVSNVAGVCLDDVDTANLAKASGLGEAGMSVASVLFQSPVVYRGLPDSRKQSFPSPRTHLLSYRESLNWVS